MHFIIVPGLNGSDHNHWQSAWESAWLANSTRIAPASWTHPDRDDWTAAIDHAVRQHADDDVVLVTHSLGCYAAAHWLTTSAAPHVRGVFMVAPPDQRAPSFPITLLPTFAGLEPSPLRLPAVLVASDDDPYCTVEAAARLAVNWTVPLVTTGRQGHINSDSDLGLWPLGQRLLTTFVAGLGLTVAT
ncbi:alpha/beta hydrolase [Kribbella sp. NPDC050281]|uniref:RBBP9/YdeN family alpha/beta hydrolase n=1 Tax=Kribbella sp. NPDC050281 TaxID=3155515 RepID=UPI0033E18621